MQRAGLPEREPGLHTKDAPELEGGNQLTEQECSFWIQTLSDGSILPRPRSPPHKKSHTRTSLCSHQHNLKPSRNVHSNTHHV